MLSKKEALANVQTAVEKFQRLETNITTLKQALTGPLAGWHLNLVNTDGKTVLVTKNPERWCRNVLAHYEQLKDAAQEELTRSSQYLAQRLGLPDEPEPEQEPGVIDPDNGGEDPDDIRDEPRAGNGKPEHPGSGPSTNEEGSQAPARRYVRATRTAHT